MPELCRMQINVVKSKGILKVPSVATIRQLTTDHSLGLGVDFTEGGKPENLEKNPRSTGETNYCTTTLLMWVWSFLRINTGLYAGGHPSSHNSCPTRLNLKFSAERQHANRICHPCCRPISPSLILNPFLPRPAKNPLLSYSVYSVMPDNFTHQGKASGWERVKYQQGLKITTFSTDLGGDPWHLNESQLW